MYITLFLYITFIHTFSTEKPLRDLVMLFYYVENIIISKTHVRVSLSFFYLVLTLTSPYLKVSQFNPNNIDFLRSLAQFILIFQKHKLLVLSLILLILNISKTLWK